MTEDHQPQPINIRELFLNLQREMTARLITDRQVIRHGPTGGAAAEANWRDMLSDYLPKRYQVCAGFVVDADGRTSRQQDVIIFDRQYCPFLFNQDDTRYVPSESIYAVFEVKQELSAANVDDAALKVASVRGLRRTTAPIVHAGGTFPARQPFSVLGGILALTSSWNPPLGPSLEASLRAQDADGRLDLGCALSDGTFEARYNGAGFQRMDVSQRDSSLAFFFLPDCLELSSVWGPCLPSTSPSTLADCDGKRGVPPRPSCGPAARARTPTSVCGWINPPMQVAEMAAR